MAKSASELKDFIRDWTAGNTEPFRKAADDLFDHPELGMQEFYSSARLAELLEQNGFAVEMGVADMPTAFLATWGGGKPVIGFSAEYDALPGLSQQRGVSTHTPVAEGAPGHGCGHNLLGVTAIYAAVALKKAVEAGGLTATIKVYGTPAEEVCIGKPFMARAGLFDDADAILDWHPGGDESGICTDSNAYFNTYYHFKGKTAHGNMPWHGRSALDAAMLTGHALEFLREHVKPGYEGAENTFNYTFADTGPEIPNVVPDRATLWCIGRFSDSEVMAEFMQRMDNCAEGAALATGTTVSKELISAIHEKIPNMAIAKILHDNWVVLGPPEFTEEEHRFGMEVAKNGGLEPKGMSGEILPCTERRSGVSDNSEYYWFAPTAMAFVGVVPYNHMLHNWMAATQFGSDAPKKAIPYVGTLLAWTGLDLITKPELLQGAQAEFRERMQGRAYQTLLGEIAPAVNLNKQAMERYRK